MAKKRTWLWILVGLFGVGVVFMLVLAAAGVYFVTSHVQAGPSSSADAFQSFDDVRAAFKDQKPVFELDVREQPRQVLAFKEMPTAAAKPTMLWVLAWDPDRERLAKVSVPFWLLRLGRNNINVVSTDEGFRLERLNLDVDELERVGPQLLFDYRAPSGERVVVWTK